MDNKLKYDDLKLQGINVDEGFTYTGSSEKYLAALQRFLRRAEKTRTAITDSIGNEDYEGLTAQVHALKSNARTIGADSLSSVAEAMELHGRMYEYDEMLSDKDELLRLFDETANMLKPYGEMEEVHPKSEISAGRAEEVAKTLLDAVEDYDGEKAITFIDELMRYPFRFTLINVLKNAREDIREYEYEEALVKIKRVISQIED